MPRMMAGGRDTLGRKQQSRAGSPERRRRRTAGGAPLAQTPEGQRMSSGGDAEGRGGEGDEEAKVRTVTGVSLQRTAEPGRRAKRPRRSSWQGPSSKTASCGRRPRGRGRATAGRRVHDTVGTAVRSGIPSGGESRAGQSFRGCPRRRTGGESATNVFCAILYVLRGHPVGRGRRGGKRARVRHLRRRRRRGGRTAARTREASAGGGEPLALPPADREEGRVGQRLRVGKPATVASRTSGNRRRWAMAIGGESCGARRRKSDGYGV